MRLIDAHILLTELNMAQIEGDELYKGLGKAKKIVIYQPTIDAVRVVRCKDCKYREQKKTFDISAPDPKCIFYLMHGNKDGFCHYGERKDES